MPITISKPFLELVRQYTSQNSYEFILAYISYCHAIDDLVDGDKTDAKYIIQCFNFAAVLYSSQYYRDHQEQLFPLIMSAGLSYVQSVDYERSKVPWKLKFADSLRSEANNVLIFIVNNESGYEKALEFSEKLREFSYKEHHTEE